MLHCSQSAFRPFLATKRPLRRTLYMSDRFYGVAATAMCCTVRPLPAQRDGEARACLIYLASVTTGSSVPQSSRPAWKTSDHQCGDRYGRFCPGFRQPSTSAR